MSCHVVVESADSRHRQGHEYKLTISVRVPDEEIRQAQVVYTIVGGKVVYKK